MVMYVFVKLRYIMYCRYKSTSVWCCRISLHDGFSHEFSPHCLWQGHQIEVRSSGGGHVTGLGTIHGNVDIFTSGDGVSAPSLER